MSDVIAPDTIIKMYVSVGYPGAAHRDEFRMDDRYPPDEFDYADQSGLSDLLAQKADGHMQNCIDWGWYAAPAGG